MLPSHNNMIAVQQLQHQAVRDLAWCCFSAPIMGELPGDQTCILPFDNQALWPWLQALDQQPRELTNHLVQRTSTRLGIYYEALWHFYFVNHPEWELLQHNLQVDRSGVTLGAFDFLCRNGDQYWHIETAVKFYLCSTNNPLDAYEWKYWIGPEGKDRLDLKLNHLRHHQLPLHQRPEAQRLLKALYPNVNTWNTGLCLQGYLFSPAQHPSHPAFSHANHGRGTWWFASELLAQLSRQPDGLWLILERSQWLSPAHEQRQGKLFSSAQLAHTVTMEMVAHGRPLLIAAMGETGLGSGGKAWVEHTRLFVTPDGWPYQSVRPGMASPARNT